jgi:hypothetical protein
MVSRTSIFNLALAWYCSANLDIALEKLPFVKVNQFTTPHIDWGTVDGIVILFLL